MFLERFFSRITTKYYSKIRGIAKQGSSPQPGYQFLKARLYIEISSQLLLKFLEDNLRNSTASGKEMKTYLL